MLVIAPIILFLLFHENFYARSLSATLPDYSIKINGELVENKRSKYPFLNYKGITYFPAIYKNSETLGISVFWNEKENVLYLKSSTSYGSYKIYRDKVNNKDNKITIPKYKISVNENIGDNENMEYPFISFRDITYVPLTWQICNDFGLEISFTGNTLEIWSKDRLPKLRELESDKIAIKDGIYFVNDGVVYFSDEENNLHKIFNLGNNDLYRFIKSGNSIFLKYGKENSLGTSKYLKLDRDKVEHLDIFFKDFAQVVEFNSKIYSFNSFDEEQPGKVYSIRDGALLGNDLFFPKFFLYDGAQYGIVRSYLDKDSIVKFNGDKYSKAGEINKSAENFDVYGENLTYVVNKFIYPFTENIQEIYSVSLKDGSSKVILNYSVDSHKLEYFVTDRGVLYKPLLENKVYLDDKVFLENILNFSKVDNLLFLVTEDEEKIYTEIYNRNGKLVAKKFGVVTADSLYTSPSGYRFYNIVTEKFENL